MKEDPRVLREREKSKGILDAEKEKTKRLQMQLDYSREKREEQNMKNAGCCLFSTPVIIFAIIIIAIVLLFNLGGSILAIIGKIISFIVGLFIYII